MSEHLDRAQMEVRLWKEIDQARFGMLGLVGGEPHHMQPMTAFADEKAGTIWFFVRRDADIVRDTGFGHTAMFCIMAKDQDFQACVGGQLSQDHDPAKIKQYWNAVTAAWFPQGKDDPMLTLLRFQPVDAEVWISKGGPAKFAWEIAKANATKSMPDVGDKAHINLN
jgi:general stress protein 26